MSRRMKWSLDHRRSWVERRRTHLLDMLGLEPEAAFGVRPGKLADLLSHVESLLDGGEVAAARADLARVRSACDALCMAQLDESPASLAAALAASLDSEDLPA